MVWCILSDQQIYSNVPFSVCANIQAKSLHKIIDTYLIRSPRVVFHLEGNQCAGKFSGLFPDTPDGQKQGSLPFGFMSSQWYCCCLHRGPPIWQLDSFVLYLCMYECPIFYSPVDMVIIFVLQSQITSLFYQTSWQSSSTTKHTILHISAGWIKRSESFWLSSQKLLLACGGVGRGIPTWTTPTWAEAWGQCNAEIVG